MEHVAGGDWQSWFKSVSLSLLHHAGRRASPTFLLGEEKAVLVEARFERTIRHAQVEVCTALEVVKEASSGRHVEQGAIPGGRLDTAGQRQGHQPRAEGWVVFKKAIVNISVVYGVMPPTRTVRRDPMPRRGDLFQSVAAPGFFRRVCLLYPPNFYNTDGVYVKFGLYLN